ncbi:MAG: methyl-accepting chemotaxis protein [Lachnospiraceae bacterium]|nr:methyl-accepting chemotaxis protein [Lachnospiraceae bacterium]
MVFGYYEAPADFIATGRPWFTGAKATSGVYYTEPYVDQISGALCISLSVATKGGVVGIDLDLSALTNDMPKPDSGYAVLITSGGSIVVHPDEKYALSGDVATNVNDVVGGAYAKTSSDAFKDYNGKLSYVTAATVKSNDWVIGVVTPKSVYDKPINDMISLFTVLLIIFCVFAAVVVAVISIKLTKPLLLMAKKVDKIVSGIQNGECDLTERVDFSSPDEIGRIAGGINKLMDELEELIPESKGAASNVSGHSEELVSISEQLSNAITGISTAVEDIANGATQQATDVQSASDNVDQIGVAIDGVAEKTSALNDLAKEMKTASMDTERQVRALQDSTLTMVEGIEKISDQIKDTSRAVDSINEKVSTISEIASQTNLLSLNASIEAARAGEMGKGFAVVAEEIGKLAINSAEAAERIREEMEGLLTSSQATVEESGKVHELTVSQQNDLNETTDKIHDLLDQINTTIDHIDSIEHDVEQCVDAKKTIVDTMESLAAISQENAASTQQTSAATTEITGTIDNLSTSAQDLHAVANELSQSLSIFK